MTVETGIGVMPRSAKDFQQQSQTTIKSLYNLEQESRAFEKNINLNEYAHVKPVYLAESQVRFLGDSAAYAEPDAAIETLTPIAGLRAGAGCFTSTGSPGAGAGPPR